MCINGNGFSITGAMPHGLVSMVTFGWEVVLMVMLSDELSYGTGAINGSIGHDGHVLIGYNGINTIGINIY